MPKTTQLTLSLVSRPGTLAALARTLADGAKRELAETADLLESQRHRLRTGAIDVEPPAAHQKRLAFERLHFGVERVR